MVCTVFNRFRPICFSIKMSPPYKDPSFLFTASPKYGFYMFMLFALVVQGHPISVVVVFQRGIENETFKTHKYGITH